MVYTKKRWSLGFLLVFSLEEPGKRTDRWYLSSYPAFLFATTESNPGDTVTLRPVSFVFGSTENHPRIPSIGVVVQRTQAGAPRKTPSHFLVSTKEGICHTKAIEPLHLRKSLCRQTKAASGPSGPRRRL